MENKKTLFEIIIDILEQHKDANLSSAEAKQIIADDICNTYYDEIYTENINHENFDLQ
jgi:hypothetical protein